MEREYLDAVGEVLGCDKLVVLEDAARCVLASCKVGGDLYLAAFSRYGDWVYAKIVPELAVPTEYWSCTGVYYTPYGVYVFARSPEEMREKLSSKKRLVVAARNLAAARVAAQGRQG